MVRALVVARKSDPALLGRHRASEQPVVGRLMDPFGPRGERIEEASGAAQPQPGLPRPPHTAIPRPLLLNRISQATAIAAGEVRAAAGVQQRDATSPPRFIPGGRGGSGRLMRIALPQKRLGCKTTSSRLRRDGALAG